MRSAVIASFWTSRQACLCSEEKGDFYCTCAKISEYFTGQATWTHSGCGCWNLQNKLNTSKLRMRIENEDRGWGWGSRMRMRMRIRMRTRMRIDFWAALFCPFFRLWSVRVRERKGERSQCLGGTERPSFIHTLLPVTLSLGCANTGVLLREFNSSWNLEFYA